MQQERRQRQDLLPRLRQDWSLHPVLQADLQPAIALTLALGRALAVALPPRVVPALAEAVLVLDLSQAPAALQPDSLAPGHPDSYLRLLAVLVPEAELARAKSTRT
jgi:hypothetical protein